MICNGKSNTVQGLVLVSTGVRKYKMRSAGDLR